MSEMSFVRGLQSEIRNLQSEILPLRPFDRASTNHEPRSTKHKARSLMPSATHIPLVSVIVPAYNCERTIEDALASVQRQTFQDLELILVNDASTDGTAALLRQATMPHEAWQVIDLPANAGPAAARNRGIAEARGTWLAFLDADDVWVDDRLGFQLDIMQQDPAAAMCCGRVLPFDKQEAGNREDDVPDGITNSVRKIALDEFARHNPVATSTVLVRKAAVNEVGGFDPCFRGPEDYDLWMRLAARQPLLFVERPLAMYRAVAGSLSMDDRTFLPQVLRVVEKAFGPGGVFETRRDLRGLALSNQFWNASWMAFHRGARAAALARLGRAWAWHWRSRTRVRRAWLRLLWRYLLGRPCRVHGRAAVPSRPGNTTQKG